VVYAWTVKGLSGPQGHMSLSTYLNIVHQRTLSRVTEELADTLTASDAADWSDVWAGS